MVDGEFTQVMKSELGSHRDNSEHEKYIKPTMFDSPIQSRYNPITEGTSWGVDNFISGFTGYEALTNADIDGYAEMFGGDSLFELYTEQELAGTKRSVDEYSLEGLILFGKKNSRNVAELAWGVDPQKTLLEHALGVQYFQGGSEEFNGAVKIIEKSRENLKKIGEDPESYIQDQMENLSGVTKAFYTGLSSERITRDLSQWQQNIQVGAIGKYGIPSFISENIHNAYAIAQKQDSELQKLGDTVNEKAKTLGESPARAKIVALKKWATEKRDEISEKHGNASQAWSSLTMDIMGIANEGYKAQLEARSQSNEEESEEPREE